MSDIAPSVPNLTLPAGWALQGYQETTQVQAGNQVVQGIKFILQGPSGNTSVFVPNAVLPNTAAVAQYFRDKINSLQNVESLFTPATS